MTVHHVKSQRLIWITKYLLKYTFFFFSNHTYSYIVWTALILFNKAITHFCEIKT